MNITTQPGVGQQKVLTRHENVIVMGGEEPVPAKSQLELGDLRHSLQARRSGQRPNGDRVPKPGEKALSRTSTMPTN